MAAGRARGVRGVSIVFASMVLAWGGLAASAAEPNDVSVQTREFSVSVDGIERGKLTMRIHTRVDQSDLVHIETDLLFKLPILQYHYSSTGTEIWKGDRLIGMDNSADYNGKKYAVKAAQTRRGLQVTVNGKATDFGPEVWATSYWRIPERIAQSTVTRIVRTAGKAPPEALPTVTVPLIDTDKGRVLSGELSRIGEESLTLGGKKVACTHYKVAGDVQAELWYDGSRRLLRQESIDQKHKTVLKLTRIATE